MYIQINLYVHIYSAEIHLVLCSGNRHLTCVLLRNLVAGMWISGKVACVGGNAGTWGALGGPARSHLQVLGRHPPSITPRALHVLANGACL